MPNKRARASQIPALNSLFGKVEILSHRHGETSAVKTLPPQRLLTKTQQPGVRRVESHASAINYHIADDNYLSEQHENAHADICLG